MKVLTYLDCGCAIMENGRRSFCPSCANPRPPEPKPEPKTTVPRVVIVMDEGLIQAVITDGLVHVLAADHDTQFIDPDLAVTVPFSELKGRGLNDAEGTLSRHTTDYDPDQVELYFRIADEREV